MPLVNKTFSDIITFSRASSATMFDSSGTLVYAPMNAIRNSSASGAVAGTPGTLPTNWTQSALAAGLTANVLGIGTSNGINYIDIRIFGTTADATGWSVFTDANTQIAASSGQVWTGSSYVAIVGGSTANITTGLIRVVERNSGGGYITESNSSWTAATAVLANNRFSLARTLGGTAAFVQFGVYFQAASGVAIDITLRIGLPQLELGSVARTAVATSGTAYQGPRLDYDPATLAARGLLIEEQRTNLFTYSEQFDNADWTKTRSSITADAAVSPDGTMDGDKLIEDTADGAHIIRFANGSYTAGTTYTISFYVKAAERNTCRIQFRSAAFTGNGGVSFDLVNVTATAEIAYATGTIAAVGNGWFRVTATSTATTTYSGVEGFYFYIGTATYPGDGTSGIYIWGAQLEAGAFPTSYIPTTTTSLTRSADVASVNTLSPWFNATEGTLFAEAVGVSNTAGATRRFVEISDGSISNRYVSGYGSTTATRFLASAGGSVQADVGVTGVNAGSLVKIAGAYAVNDFQQASNGNLSGNDTSGALPAVTTMHLGSDYIYAANTTLNGHIRRITYYPRRLSNAELQAITT